MDGFLERPLFHVGDTAVTAASLLVSLLILAGSYVLGRLARKFVAQRLLARTHLSIGMRYALGRFAGYLVFFFGAAMALQAVGVRVTTLAAFGAALGVGIGFGLQDVVKSFVAGLVLLIERPFQVGDRIEIEKTTAEVVEIRARATVLRTNDDVHLIIPNAKFISDIVTNRTYGNPTYRCHAPVHVGLDADPAAVRAALLEAAEAWARGRGHERLTLHVFEG
ncbi:MAG TPA: mechanosensitive ion channel domain-containing protein, partial [Thermoanaerobaculia bacterium]|nr:mechanosensitive ion channel domain-containing protein [Thermoanaerobaculia bacterium]